MKMGQLKLKYIYIYFNVEITSAVFTLFWFEPTSTPNFKEIKIFN